MNALAACALAVENTLTTANVVLTMGGEPTFVPRRPEGAEWATAALGPTKLGYARRFAQALIARARPGSVLLETSGKHYPGEPLPRWALLLQWLPSSDASAPLWSDPSLLKSDGEPGTHTLAEARVLVTALLSELALPATSALPLSESVPATEADTATTRASGWVVPLDHVDGAWRTDAWAEELGAEALELIPGDSLAGLRLPLAALSETRLRRALTAELCDGSITVFIPPLLHEGYVALVQAIERAVKKCGLRDLVLAGYAPPYDAARLPTIGFASDPGVLEINLTPCPDWCAYDDQLRDLYAAADAVGLCAQKFQLNGREVGTGGGAHLVFGGPTPETSPFFLHPSLLPSVIRYFQHHPALSYAFSGLYMGPSSQAPRIDESTYEALYELEIACDGAARLGTPANLQLFDLLFRDLLMDRSGNTHRAEISVDKLWNPFAGNGRLGLVEFRAFETYPDHAVQSLAALFVRAIIARLALAPLSARFIRWQGELHDKFFLPSFVWDDLQAVCEDLQIHGIPFQAKWLRPLWEWRFPAIGRFDLIAKIAPAPDAAKDAEPVESPFSILFRQALEAWPLLGESPNAGGVARTVDASMDRIEAHVTDVAALEQGLLLVNGFPCAFRPADHGAAAGIRYRAFYLYPALQPHRPADAPLLLEWVDKASLTVVAAARWHSWNPRNASYSARPADAAEAAERRAERWEAWPHSLGQSRYIAKVDFAPESRYTLDLRRTDLR
ncbi:MAG: transglutaminase family protein [Verrucomicrobia bacterium]|nr:transglutaminase family protein [Verrucomicrobiota bacterium]